jgi:hypothetical protein
MNATLQHLRTRIVPRIQARFEGTFRTSLTSESKVRGFFFFFELHSTKQEVSNWTEKKKYTNDSEMDGGDGSSGSSPYRAISQDAIPRGVSSRAKRNDVLRIGLHVPALSNRWYAFWFP